MRVLRTAGNPLGIALGPRDGRWGRPFRLALPVWPPSADLGPQAELGEHLHGEGEGALLVIEADEWAALPG